MSDPKVVDGDSGGSTADSVQRESPSALAIHLVYGKPVSPESCASYTKTIMSIKTSNSTTMMNSLGLGQPDKSPLVKFRFASRHQKCSLDFSTSGLRALPHKTAK